MQRRLAHSIGQIQLHEFRQHHEPQGGRAFGTKVGRVGRWSILVVPGSMEGTRLPRQQLEADAEAVGGASRRGRST